MALREKLLEMKQAEAERQAELDIRPQRLKALLDHVADFHDLVAAAVRIYVDDDLLTVSRVQLRNQQSDTYGQYDCPSLTLSRGQNVITFKPDLDPRIGSRAVVEIKAKASGKQVLAFLIETAPQSGVWAWHFRKADLEEGSASDFVNASASAIEKALEWLLP